VPVFPLFAAGVTLGGLSGLVESLTDRVALGIIAGLVVGKTVGVFGATYLVARLTRARLDQHLRWVDVLGLSILAGVGFTVSLLIGELAFGTGSARDDHVKVGVLIGPRRPPGRRRPTHPQPRIPANRRGRRLTAGAPSTPHVSVVVAETPSAPFHLAHVSVVVGNPSVRASGRQAT